MVRRLTTLAALCAFALLAAPEASPEKPVCTGWKLHGLPGSVADIAKASDGTIWLAASPGIYRLGPCGWEIHQPSRGLYGSFPEGFSIWFDAKGDLWTYRAVTYRGTVMRVEYIRRFDGTEWQRENDLPAEAP